MKTKQHTTVSTFSTLLNPTIFARQQQSQQSNLDLPSKKDVNTNELCKKKLKNCTTSQKLRIGLWGFP